MVISAFALHALFRASRAARNPSMDAVRYPRRKIVMGFSLVPPGLLFGLWRV